VGCSGLQWVAVGCNVLQCVAVCCSVLHDGVDGKFVNKWYLAKARVCTATHYNTLQLATHCNSLQHTATRCNTQQHKATKNYGGCCLSKCVRMCVCVRERERVSVHACESEWVSERVSA